jgi:hypothetical protein
MSKLKNVRFCVEKTLSTPDIETKELFTLSKKLEKEPVDMMSYKCSCKENFEKDVTQTKFYKRLVYLEKEGVIILTDPNIVLVE